MLILVNGEEQHGGTVSSAELATGFRERQFAFWRQESSLTRKFRFQAAELVIIPSMCWISWEGKGVPERQEIFEGEVPLKIRKLAVCFEKPMQSNLPKDLDGV